MLEIPDQEYKDRIRKFQANIRKAGLDAALVHGNEADFANVRYLSEYWPTFEAGGVFVPAKGQPAHTGRPSAASGAVQMYRCPIMSRPRSSKRCPASQTGKPMRVK